MARRILDVAESIDGYRGACAACPANALARKGNQYLPFFLSEEDAKRLRTEIFKVELLNGSEIVILHSSADNGYPHTRPKEVVCIPDSYVKSATDSSLAEVLRHEAMHIHQRKFPELWRQRVIQDGWTPVSVEKIPPRFRGQCRINPDTMACPFWAWDSYHVPLPIFKQSEQYTLGDIRIEWFDMRTGALFHEPPKSFTAKYGSPSQPEHPYEIYAVAYAAEGISTHARLYSKLVQG